MDQASSTGQKRPKPPYPPLENLGFMLKKIALWDKSMFLWGALEVPALVLLPLLAVYMSKLVVEAVTNSQSPLDFLLIVLAFSAAILLCNAVINTCGNMLYNKSTLIRFRYINLCSEKIMETDFRNVESPQGQGKMKRAVKLMDAMKAQTVVGGRVEGAQQVVGQMTHLFSGLFGVITYGAIIYTLSPWIIALILLSTVAGYLIDKRFTDYLFSTRKIWRPLDERINYIKYTLDDPARAKDVILYNIKKWMTDFFRATARVRTEWHYRIFRRHFASNAMGELCALLRDALALGYLVYMMVSRGMPISDFVLYFGVIGGFSGLLLDFAFQAQGIYETTLEFCDYREFLDMPDALNRAEGVPPAAGALEIGLNDVCFSYAAPGVEPDEKAYVLKHIDIHIKKGEKIAVVGATARARPSQADLRAVQTDIGFITLGNTTRRTITSGLLFPVLHGISGYLHRAGVHREDVAMCPDARLDRAKAEHCLKQAELWDKVCSLPQGMDTLLVRGVNEGALELSGGEQQKLVLARALYKDGGVIVLDEPTAALDPIAENRLYLKYNELTAGKTSVFISHRLSSTRFCERIFFLENGEVTECGTHEELMARNGGYAAMFNVQSYYYREHAGEDGNGSNTAMNFGEVL